MSVGNDCLYEFSVDRLYDVLSEGLQLSANKAVLDVLEVCRHCDQRDCPGIGRMMAENASTEPAYRTVGRVVSYPPHRTLHLVVGSSRKVSLRTEVAPEPVAEEVAG